MILNDAQITLNYEEFKEIEEKAEAYDLLQDKLHYSVTCAYSNEFEPYGYPLMAIQEMAWNMPVQNIIKILKKGD